MVKTSHNHRRRRRRRRDLILTKKTESISKLGFPPTEEGEPSSKSKASELMVRQPLTLAFLTTDSEKRKLLDWKRLLDVIEGVAHGQLYLHKYSRLKVIHRDLKASNILLDKDMHPKISDFRMDRIFGQNESRANTNPRIYMSPKYAMKGIFSVKSDVFSFGVLLLKIVTGKRNSVFTSSSPISLIEQTWDQWSNGDILELKDLSLGSSCPKNELVRIVQVGLLCVQENATDRPTMSDVVMIITNDNVLLPDPKKAAYCIGKSSSGESSNGKPALYSVNDVSISIIEAR